jgi:hypothetical protein
MATDRTRKQRRRTPAEMGGGQVEAEPTGGGPIRSSLTLKVRATRHVVWAMLIGWLVLVVLVVVLFTVL